jgi:uncharacterized protein
MNNRASSFPADASRPWHRDRWPWLLMVGPLAVVVACAASAWMAVRSDDGVVAQDYYKQGLLINQKLRRTAPMSAPVRGATLSVESDRRIHVRLVEAEPPPRHLRLTLTRPGDRAHGQRMELAISGDEWVGSLPELGTGRWIVELESERWQLPITIVAAPFTELTLGSVSPHS